VIKHVYHTPFFGVWVNAQAMFGVLTLETIMLSGELTSSRRKNILLISAA
jgi:hypothetical protein